MVMKSFKEYLTESKKTYAFKVKVAGEMHEGFEAELKSAMDKFSVVKIGAGKRTPIQETPLDFPELKNKQVTVWEVEVNYPTTPQVLENYIAEVCGCSLSCIRVRAANEPSEQYQLAMMEPEKDSDALLNTDYPNEDNQGLVGEKSKMNLLKELEKVKHGGEQYTGVNDALLAKDAPSEKATVMPDGNTVSPIGSKAQKGK
jgi:hypothetical protein